MPVNMFNGIFNITVTFDNGLNIISGVNGTGKTQILRLLKENKGITSTAEKSSDQLSIFAISPKRNTEKEAIDSIFQQVRTQNKTIKTFFGQIKGFQIKDSGFENYPSFAELFIQEYDSLMQDGVTGHKLAIEKTSESFNEVLSKVFPEYKIKATWVLGETDLSGKLDLKISKYSTEPISIEYLSTGEREMFALLFAIFVSRHEEDIYLIDEPEIHLNWDLEKGLFQFFDWFGTKFEKQIIIVTHSRIIFKKEFYPRTQFLVWKNNQIISRSEITDKQKESIAGELSDSISISDFSKTTYFVEDETQKLIINFLAEKFNKTVSIVVCGNKSNVKSMYSLLLKEQSDLLYFLVDGDNEGNGIVDPNFISLGKYCIENYLLNISILSSLLSKTEDQIKIMLVDCLKKISSNKHFLVYKKLAENSSDFPLDVLDTYSGKDLLKCFASDLNKTVPELTKEILEKIALEDKLDGIFSEIIPGIK